MRRKTIALGAVLGLLVSVVALIFILNMTNPSDSGPAGILAVLVLIYVLAYSAILLTTVLFEYTYRLIAPRQQDETVAVRTKRFYIRLLAVCAVLATVPILFISLNSIGRLGFLDIVLIAAIEIVAVFYVLKKT